MAPINLRRRVQRTYYHVLARGGVHRGGTRAGQAPPTRTARALAEKRLEAEQKRFQVGLNSTFELFQAQRDLAAARNAELNATIAYNQSLVDFEAVQTAPIR